MSENVTTPETGTETTEQSTTETVSTLLSECMKMLDWNDAEFEVLVQNDIDAAKIDLGIAGVTKASAEENKMIRTAIISYVMMRENAGTAAGQQHEKIYNSIKGNLMHATGYTDWGDGSEEPEEDASDAEGDGDDDPGEGGDG